jgi:hypothetical protein
MEVLVSTDQLDSSLAEGVPHSLTPSPLLTGPHHAADSGENNRKQEDNTSDCTSL